MAIMEKMVQELVIGDKMVSTKFGTLEIVGIKYEPWKGGKSVNCMTGEGGYYFLTYRKPNGAINTTGHWKPRQRVNII
jgi:hypothetical protein